MNDILLSIQSGQTVALVGASGGGKRQNVYTKKWADSDNIEERKKIAYKEDPEKLRKKRIKKIQKLQEDAERKRLERIKKSKNMHNVEQVGMSLQEWNKQVKTI